MQLGSLSAVGNALGRFYMSLVVSDWTGKTTFFLGCDLWMRPLIFEAILVWFAGLLDAN